MIPTSAAVFLLCCAANVASTSAPNPATTSAQATASTSAVAAEHAPLVDAPLAESRRALLDLAFGAANAMPSFPHVKTRSRLQQDVLTAALELDQPCRARDGAAQVENWRRGLVLADLAVWAATHRVGDVDAYVAEAERIAASVDASLNASPSDVDRVQVERPQSWQRDRILVRLLQARAARGESTTLRTLPTDVDAAQVTRLGPAPTPAEAIDLANEFEWVDRVVAAGVFDVVRAALDRCVEVYGRVYDDPERRSAVDAKIRASWGKLPIDVRIDLLLDLAEVASAHGDARTTSSLIDGSQTLRLGATWLPEQEIPLLARTAMLRARAGERDRALRLADDAWKRFEAKRDAIVDVERARALRPLAEAWIALGDAARARDVYARVIDEGFVNPNARPRCEDFVATCLSMARHAFEPDEATWTRLRRIRADLRDPW